MDKQNNEITLVPIKSVSFSAFDTLITYLKEMLTRRTDINADIIDLLDRFFPNMSALAQIEMKVLAEDPSVERYLEFQEKYPDILVDNTGRSTPTKKLYWQVSEKALNDIYDAAVENVNNSELQKIRHSNQQIIYAKTLENLKSPRLSSAGAMVSKTLLLKQIPGIAAPETFQRIEAFIQEIVTDGLKFLSRLYNYTKHVKPITDAQLFLDHVFMRIDLLQQDKDLISKSNAEFKANIVEICMLD